VRDISRSKWFQSDGIVAHHSVSLSERLQVAPSTGNSEKPLFLQRRYFGRKNSIDGAEKKMQKRKTGRSTMQLASPSLAVKSCLGPVGM
jgi:hypothetical protein